jgi:hypothetical protein
VNVTVSNSTCPPSPRACTCSIVASIMRCWWRSRVPRRRAERNEASLGRRGPGMTGGPQCDLRPLHTFRDPLTVAVARPAAYFGLPYTRSGSQSEISGT